MKFKFLLLYLTIFVAILGINLPFKANAASSSSILVNMSPENPAPNENVNITLNSYANNLDSVLISWSVNGKNISSGIGKKTFSLNAPNAGGNTSVVATINLPDGTVNTNMTIKPSVMVLLWQAQDSYVPPFYKGKAMPSADSSVKVVAMPEIKSGAGLVNPKTMTYSWKKDYTNNVDGSGYGKNSFTYVNDYLENSNNISVTASTISQNISSNASIDIGMTQPKILFYINNIYMGTLWEQALFDGYKILGDTTLEAVPYFISPGDIRTPLLNWTWSINDTSVATSIGIIKNLIPLKIQAGVSGTSKVKLDIENIYKLTGNASGEINLQF
ncbi:MAG: hypothetical protein WC793_01890 [Candidatus Paceibacterota bacterium]|jgi:hypothetical protein